MRPGCGRVTIVQRMHGCCGTTSTSPMRTICPHQPSSSQPSPEAFSSTFGRKRRTSHWPAGSSAAPAGAQAGGGHQQEGHGVDEAIGRHRPLDRLARVVGRIGEVLGRRSPCAAASTRRTGRPSHSLAALFAGRVARPDHGRAVGGSIDGLSALAQSGCGPEEPRLAPAGQHPSGEPVADAPAPISVQAIGLDLRRT